jgi:hypothetical protein
MIFYPDTALKAYSNAHLLRVNSAFPCAFALSQSKTSSLQMYC